MGEGRPARDFGVDQLEHDGPEGLRWRATS
jgi:hypothetical protein